MKLIRLTRSKPQIITCDLHPNLNSTIFAQKLAKKYHKDLIQIQHHKAHVASVAGEHGLTDYIGIAMDGLGYGEDNKLWGGEVFSVTKGYQFTRIGHLEEQPQLGGDSATIYPKNMLFGILSRFLSEQDLLKLRLFNERKSRIYLKILQNDFNIQYTTSTGRILDAVSALLGFCDMRTYDGRPAMILESKATIPSQLEPVFSNDNGKTILLTVPLFDFLLQNKKEKGKAAATAQMYIANGLYAIAEQASKKKKIPIVFSGGVAYNKMISGFMIQHNVLVNKEIPSGDGGICYGQAYLANMQRN